MTPREEQSILQRYPIEILYISALVLAILGFVLMLTVVGTIAGLPLLVVAAALAYVGHHKSRSRRPSAEV